MYYFGEVVQGVTSDDGPHLGRIKVWVRGVHSPLLYGSSNISILPWAIVLASSANAGVEGRGSNDIAIETGAQVLVTFADEDKQFPIVLGVIPRTTDYEMALNASGPDRMNYGSVSSDGRTDGMRGLNNSPGAGSYSPSVVGQFYSPDYEGVVGTNIVPPERIYRDFCRWMVNTQSINYDHAKRLAAGIIGNVYMESFPKFSPLSNHPNGAFGLFQWLGPRKRHLINWASAQGDMDYKTYEAQRNFVFHENTVGEPGTGFTQNWSKIVNHAKTVETAACYWAVWWERTDGTGTGRNIWDDQGYIAFDKLCVSNPDSLGASSANMKDRVEYALGAYNDFKDMIISGIDTRPVADIGT